MSESTPIPATANDVTAAWLTHVLEPHLDGSVVTSVVTSPVGTGQMALALRLSVTYEQPTTGPAALPDSFVVKMHAADETSRSTGLALRAYEIEVRFYEELAGTLPIRTPRAFAANVDLASGAFVLLLQDMAPACQGDQLAGCTLQEAELAVDELVSLHSSRWDDASLYEMEWLHRDPQGSQSFLAAGLPPFWQVFAERYHQRIGPEVRHVGEALVTRLDDVLAIASGPLTVVHGDYRLDNLLFGGEAAAAPIAVVDWQLVSHGTGLQDVAYFLGASFSPEVRRRHEDALLHRYYERLCAAGVSSYSWDDCFTAYRHAAWAGFITAVVAANLVERTDRGDDMFLVMAHRHASHVMDLAGT